jgi:hypothetical protein
MQDIPEKAFDINTLSCYVCNYTASTKSNFKNHIYSMKHYRNIQKMDDAVDQLLEKANLNRLQDISIPSYDATFSDTSIAHTPPPLHIIATLTEPPKKVARTRKPQTKQMKTTKDPTDNLQGDCQQEDVEDPTYSQLFDDCHEHSMGGIQHVISVSAVFTSFVAVAGYFIYAYSK